MRRPATTLLLALSTLALVAGVSLAAPAGAQGCSGDLVSASMSATSATGPTWSVTDACVDARDYFTGEVEGHQFAIGISTVTYDDGHVGRLAFLSVRVDAAQAVTVVGMEDPATSQLHFAGTVRQAAIGTTGATVSGDGIAFPPLEAATVRLDFTDSAAPWPDWATTTTTPDGSGSTVPTTTAPPSTTTPAVTTTVPSTSSLPSVPGMDLSTTTLVPGA
ncbi:hypothetical protein [Dermatobacter hominis]|uniref:hypothetical protein n=1 Tax=Dermatobacter hominis TaxID=2884263 RepID=UPI001D106DFE|nr:hypothetical protein [Dermatobacter hominis]UDY35449.1 hypothetical protein LH044_19230 [Dermatobacter hominis]